MKWFESIYCFRKYFNSIEDLNAAIAAGKELDNIAPPADTDTPDKRIDILMNYLSGIQSIGQNDIRNFGNAIGAAALIKKSNIDALYDKLAQLSFAEANYQMYAFTLARIYKQGDAYFTKNISTENVDAISLEKVAQIAKKFNEVKSLPAENRTLEALVSLYYEICTYEKNVHYIHFSALYDGKNAGPYGDVMCLYKLVKSITDIKSFRNTILVQFYGTLLETDNLTDKEFFDYFNKFKSNFVNVDADKLKSDISTINGTFKDSKLCSVIFDNLNNNKYLENSPAKSLFDEMKKLKISDRNLRGLMEMIIDFMSEGGKSVDKRLVNPQNIEDVITLVNKCIDEIVNAYFAICESTTADIDTYNSLMTNIVKISTEQGFVSNYSLTECIIRWNSFFNSPVYKSYQTGFDTDIKNWVRDVIDFNKTGYNIKIKDKDIPVFTDKISDNFKFIIGTIVKEKFIPNIYRVLLENDYLNNKANDSNNKLIFRKESLCYIQIKVINSLLQFLIDCFKVKYSTQITMKRGNASGHAKGYYDAACNIIYRKDLNVNESLSENFMIYKNRYIILEDLSEDMDQYFEKLDKVIKDSGSSDVIDYVNKKAKYDDSEQKSDTQINNTENTAVDSSIVAAAQNLNATVNNYKR